MFGLGYVSTSQEPVISRSIEFRYVTSTTNPANLLDMNNYYNFQDSFRPISIPRARAGQVTLTGKRGCDSERKKGVLENRSERLFGLFLKFLHQVGKSRHSFFLLASVFPTGFFTAEVLRRSTRFNGFICIWSI